MDRLEPVNSEVSCPGCETPRCAEVCPINALSRDEAKAGVIRWNGARCIQCHLCVAACPYNGIQFDLPSGVLTGRSQLLAQREEQSKRFEGGHALCAGCGIPIVVRMVLNSIREPVVVATATGCLEVATTLYPYTAWNVPWVHNAFENTAANISGVETAYRVLKRKGKVDKEIKFVAFGGDGGTYDIGLQALSGALERGHNFLYVCYDNQAYMNTGNQRSSATPMGAFATTEPSGTRSSGKRQWRKDLTEIIAAHHIPYIAQASISHWQDFASKAEKAASVEGPSFINVLSPCPRGWGYEPSLTVEIARLAVETRFWPLYEVEGGIYRINYKPQRAIDINTWLRKQERFTHLCQDKNKKTLATIQSRINSDWERLVKKCARP